MRRSDKVIDIDALKDSGYYFRKAEEFYLGGMLIESLKYLHKSIYFSSGETKQKVMMGQIFTDLGLFDCAKQTFFECLLVNEHDFSSEIGLAIVCRLEGNWDGANFYAEKTLTDCGDNTVFREVYRSLLAGVLGKDISELEDEKLSLRNKFSVVSDNAGKDSETSLLDKIGSQLYSEDIKEAELSLKEYRVKYKDGYFLKEADIFELIIAQNKSNYKKMNALADKMLQNHGNLLDWLYFRLAADKKLGNAEEMFKNITVLNGYPLPEDELEKHKLVGMLIENGLNERVVELLNNHRYRRGRLDYQLSKALAIALYNTGNKKKSLGILRNLDEIFGRYRDAHYYLNYILRHDAESDGRLKLGSEFDVPEGLAEEYRTILLDNLEKPSAQYRKTFNADKSYRDALRWAFDCGEYDIISYTTDKMIASPHVDFINFLQEMLLVCNYENPMLNYALSLAILSAEKKSRIRFKKSDCVKSFSAIDVSELKYMPPQFGKAYLMFVTGHSVFRDTSAKWLYRSAKLALSLIKDIDGDGKKFKSAGAIAACMSYVADGKIIESDTLGNLCTVYRTNKKTIRSYLAMLGIKTGQ